MNDNDAQTIVYAFIDHVAVGKPYIGDASSLPYPKETIRQAFHKHLEHYEGMRRLCEETFSRLHYDETVRQLGSMLFFLDDWYDIAPEDKESVARLNAIEGPPPSWAMPLIAKYFGRSEHSPPAP